MVKKNFRSKSFWVKKILSQKIFGLNKFLSKKVFWVKKKFGSKKFWIQKDLGPKIFGQKIVGLKFCWIVRICPKRFFVKKKSIGRVNPDREGLVAPPPQKIVGLKLF